MTRIFIHTNEDDFLPDWWLDFCRYNIDWGKSLEEYSAVFKWRPKEGRFLEFKDDSQATAFALRWIGASA